MKSKKNLLEQLKGLSHFDKDIVLKLGRQTGLKDVSVNTYISRFLKSKDIYRLKNGLYVSNDFLNRNRDDVSYSFYLANIIRKPSYVSSWAALQYYGLTTEAIHSITSVTRRGTAAYDTRAGNFSYQSIQKDLFSSFTLVRGRFDFFIASPAKALFDLLYFRTRQLRGVSREEIDRMIEDLRIDIDAMSREELEKFYTMIKKYE